MPDQFTKVVRHGYGSRIMGSIKGIFFGLLFFILSFGVLYWNEGRVDVSKIAETAILIGSESADPSADGQLVSAYGTVKTEETLGDDLYLKPGDYLSLARNVEMYAWIEHSETKTEKNLGGSETQTTTYTYTKGWTSNPVGSSGFEHPEGHENPEKPVENKTITVQNAMIGIYRLSPGKLSLPGSTRLALGQEMMDYKDDIKLKGDYIFRGKGSLEQPMLGDIRISYSAVPNNMEGTVFGKLNGSQIDPFVNKEAKLYRLFLGTHDEAVATLATEHSMKTWILRLVGFVLMWVGLGMVFGPISVLLDVVPFFGSVSRFAINGAAFLVALILSVVTILVSMIFHSPIALVVIAILSAGILYYVFKAKQKKA